jgi:lipopolysaccharide export system protein LptA
MAWTRFLFLIIGTAALAGAAPVLAQTKASASGAGGLGGSYNSKGPIEITSDSLEVLQQENKAIFSGRVLAAQGDVKLKADKMTVHYRSGGDKQNGDKQKSKKEGEESQNAIEKIDVNGNVFLSTPEETASGDNGTYDVANRQIHLNDNVVLTRGKNVLRGGRLVYDFATGRSALNTPDANTDGPNKKPRVRALFMPDEASKP